MTELHRNKIWCLDHVDGERTPTHSLIRTDCQQLERCDRSSRYRLRGASDCLPIDDYYACRSCSSDRMYSKGNSLFFYEDMHKHGFIDRWDAKFYHKQYTYPGAIEGVELSDVFDISKKIETKYNSLNIKFLSVTQSHHDRYTEYCLTRANFEDPETKTVYSMVISYEEDTVCSRKSPTSHEMYLMKLIGMVGRDRKLVKAFKKKSSDGAS